MKRLPDKPSDLIRLALHDLELVEQDPRYKVDMGEWHQSYRNKCEVCFAGAVIAKSIKANYKKRLYPAFFDDDTQQKLLALDSLRTGKIAFGLYYFYYPKNPPDGWSDDGFGEVSGYRQDPKLFKEQMFELSCALEGAGL